jgi:hypothetical protein
MFGFILLSLVVTQVLPIVVDALKNALQNMYGQSDPRHYVDLSREDEFPKHSAV